MFYDQKEKDAAFFYQMVFSAPDVPAGSHAHLRANGPERSAEAVRRAAEAPPLALKLPPLHGATRRAAAADSGNELE